jgi:hypothetical protein
MRDGMSYQIKKLDLSGVLDHAIAITKDHFGVLVKIVVILQVPVNLVLGLSLASLMPQSPAMGASEEAQAEYFKELVAAFQQNQISFAVLIGLSLLSAMILLPVTNAAIIDAVAKLYLGEKASVGDSIKTAFSRFWPLVWTMLLTGVAIMFGMIFCILPGILFAFWFSLAIHVVVLERLNGGAAMQRSKDLVTGNLGTLFILGLIIGGIGGLSGVVASLVPQFHLQIVVRTLMQSVMMVLSTAAFVVFYFSCRCGHENFDLEHLANNMGVEDAERFSSEYVHEADDIFEE